jgi:lysozyme family protein
MKGNFERALAIVLRHEGGFVNHPNDPGGMTNNGITKKVYDAYMGKVTTEQEMRDMPENHVAEIYRKQYWDRVNADSLASGLDLSVFDWAVNSGCGRAVKALQKCVGVKQDGGLGPITLKSVNEHDAEELIEMMSVERETFYRKLKTFEHFGKGWLRRNKETRSHALANIED